MAIQYVNIPETDFSRGIDARSAENQISEGFVLDLLNADVIEKNIKKRTGYESYAGNIPVRVSRLDYSQVNGTTVANLTLDTSISLLGAGYSAPISIYGKSSNLTSGPFVSSQNSARYFKQFTVPYRKTLISSGSPPDTYTILNTEHQLNTTNFFCNIAECTKDVGTSYSKIFTDSLSINSTTYDIDIKYTLTPPGTTIDALVYYLKPNMEEGVSYLGEWNHTGSGSETFSISPGLHNLNVINGNILYRIYQVVGSTWQEVEVDSFILEYGGLGVTVRTTINSTTASKYYILLTTATPSNTLDGSITATSVNKKIIVNNVTSPWVFYNIYSQKSSIQYESVEPDSVTFDEETQQLIFTFNTEIDILYKLTYETGIILSNVIQIPASGAALGVDNFPQLTVWGLDHTKIYSEKISREGWANHLDTYKRAGEQKVITGLGGNLFIAKNGTEIDPISKKEYKEEYDYPTLYPSLQAITAPSKQKLGRVFYDTEDTPGRTRGYITTDNGGTGWALVTSVEYETLLAGYEGTTKYTLHVPNMKLFNKDNSLLPTTTNNLPISTAVGLEDWLTVNNMSYKAHEGIFKVKKVEITQTDYIEVWVENTNNSSDYDDLNTGGYAGIFTDRITWSVAGTNRVYFPQDKLFIFEEEFAEVYSSYLGFTVCGPFEYLVDISENTLITGSRTSSIIPVRTLTSAPSVSLGPVCGDMLSYTEINRQLKVISTYLNVNTLITMQGIGNDTVEITCVNPFGTLLYPKQKILISSSIYYDGVHEIDTILSDTKFTIKSKIQEPISNAVLIGNIIEVDEEFTWKDSPYNLNTLQVEHRWIPIESPSTLDNLPPPTHIRHFDSAQYTFQPFIRSTMVADNLYLTNGLDEVMKFDGQNIYRAGLPAWQPGLFATVDTEATAKIVVPAPRSVSYTGLTEANRARGEIEVNAEDLYAFPIGTLVLIDGDPKYYTVRGFDEKTSGGGDPILLFDRALSSTITASGTIKEIVGSYKYYFRLNAIDANDNIIASAITSSEDFEVQMTQDAAINLKLVGMPALDNYDYNRIEVEIYRTHLLLPTIAPVFYKVVTLGSTSVPPINFNNSTGYLEYTDSAADTDLTELDKTSALSGAELGIGWSDPLRAKYITSTDNRLVLANISDYAELNIQIDGAANLTSDVFAGDSFVFRKDSEDLETVTDMVNRVKFEWKNAFSGNASSFVIGTNEFSFTTSIATGAEPGDWIYLTYDTVATTGRSLKYSGWWQIKEVTPLPSPLIGDTIVVNLTGASAATNYPNKYVLATDPTNVPVYLGPDGNLGQINGDSSGTSMETFDATRRMALAVNSVMRMTDVSLLNMTEFKPWMIARSGNDVTRAGNIVIKFPQHLTTTPSVLPTFDGYALYVNSLATFTNIAVDAVEAVYPSRVLVSYPNYPEIFDTPTAILDQDSLSAIDINPADGQEITGIIPFFGEAAFTAAQQAGVLVVFKTNSIYLVDINQKVSGGNLVVQRLETQGLGCTAPYSIASTKNGILFANNSGLYCLRRNQAIEYVGKFMERNWTEQVEKQALSIAHGHHYATGRMYKLSVPIVDTVDKTTGYIEPSQVYVYNHTQEAEGKMGAWSRYDNHTAIGWANLASDAFWASTGGNVYILRTTGTETDFRDSNQPIKFKLDTRPNSYGNSGIRKILNKLLINYRAGSATASNNLYFSIDLEQEYSETTPFRIAGTRENLTGISDLVQKDVITLTHNIGRRKGVYFSIRIENNNLDENVEVAGLDYQIGALNSEGIKTASET